jgi:CoA:oxalate CoA-transferase
VLVENYRGGAMERLGYGFAALRARFPRLIYAAVSGFGQTGPYKTRPAYDLVVQGMGGIMSLTGHPGGPPTRVGSSIGDITAGLFTAVGINAALYQRQQTGSGQMIDVAMLDCQVAILENAIARYVASGQVPGPLGARHPSIAPFEAYASAAGWIVIAAGNDALFAALANAIDRADLAGDPRYLTNELRTRNADALKIEIEGALAAHPADYWLRRVGDAGIPCGPINNVAEVLADPQVVARNMVVSATDTLAGPLTMAGNPIKLSDSPDPKVRRAAPDLDADRARILAEFA